MHAAPLIAMRILLLEDDPGLADVARLVLEHGLHTVRSTPSGLEAVAIASREPFDLALLDIEVEELSGLGVERVLHDLQGLPVVMMSGQTSGWRKEALRGGAVACLNKPFDVEKLLELTRAVEASESKGPPLAGDVRVLEQRDLDRISRMSTSEVDALPFGAIRLDREGRVLTFNAFEAGAAGLRPDDVIGRRFVDIAPCVFVRDFVEKLESEENAAVDSVLRFVFPHHGAACVVSVRLYRPEGDEQLWLFVSKRTHD